VSICRFCNLASRQQPETHASRQRHHTRHARRSPSLRLQPRHLQDRGGFVEGHLHDAWVGGAGGAAVVALEPPRKVGGWGQARGGGGAMGGCLNRVPGSSSSCDPTQSVSPHSPLNQPTNQPTNQSSNQPTNQPTTHSTNQPTTQPTIQLTNRDSPLHMSQIQSHATAGCWPPPSAAPPPPLLLVPPAPSYSYSSRSRLLFTKMLLRASVSIRACVIGVGVCVVA